MIAHIDPDCYETLYQCSRLEQLDSVMDLSLDLTSTFLPDMYNVQCTLYIVQHKTNNFRNF